MTLNTSLLQFENELWEKGTNYIAGVDEAGRGPLAGPIVVAAVILNKDHFGNSEKSDLLENYSKINDSKKISEKNRKALFDFITEKAICYQIEEISSKEIDEFGIAKANQIGFFNATNRLVTKAEHVLTDHFAINAMPKSVQTNITKGDSRSISIAAASILAKVYRDEQMLKWHQMFPEYGFDKHKGYGTVFHREMIATFGACEIHRKSFSLSL